MGINMLDMKQSNAQAVLWTLRDLRTATIYTGNLYGEIVWKSEKTCSKIDLTNLEAAVNLALDAYPNINILAFSLPGVEHGGIILTIDYKDLEGVLFSQHFHEKYGLPVLIENDVNAAIFGYSKIINSSSVNVGIYFPRHFNPGAAIFINGKVLKGAHGFAGEVRHLLLGIDWPTLNYDDTQLVGATIAKLIKVFGYIINPDNLILYGDFFTASVRQAIEQALPKHATHALIPRPVYTNDLESHIMTGLMAQALEIYKLQKMNFDN